MSDTRYPYTYAADLIRMTVGANKLSRSDASQIRKVIADAIGMNDAELARKLADHFKEHEQMLVDRSVAAFASTLKDHQ